jgi:hypothetical protein
MKHLLMYALVFVLGFVVARMMRGRLVEGTRKKKKPILPIYKKVNGECCIQDSECASGDCNQFFNSKIWTGPCSYFGVGQGVCGT